MYFLSLDYNLYNVPGNEVPNATNAMAVIVSVRPIVQPNYMKNKINNVFIKQKLNQ